MFKKMMSLFSNKTLEENHKLIPQKIHRKTIDKLLEQTYSYNGYQREEAVKLLGKIGNSEAIEVLIVRLNDWVSQVRSAAKEAILLLLTRENAASFIEFLPKLYKLQKQNRDDHRIIIGEIEKFLIEPENSDHLIDAISHKDFHISRISFGLCLEYQLLPADEIIRKFITHEDVIIRLKVVKLIKFNMSEKEYFLSMAIGDPYMQVRREGFLLYLKYFPEKRVELCKVFLFDKHMSIREISIKHLAENNIDIKKLLKTSLFSEKQNVSRIKAIISTLAYLKEDSLLEIAMQYYESQYPSVRKTALQAIFSIETTFDNKINFLLRGITDMSPSVSKEAGRISYKKKISLTSDELLNIVVSSKFSHTLPVCLSISRKMDMWKRLLFILTLFDFSVEKNDQSKNRILIIELSKWVESSVSISRSPSLADSEQIVALYNKVKSCFYNYKNMPIGLFKFTLCNYDILSSSKD